MVNLSDLQGLTRNVNHPSVSPGAALPTEFLVQFGFFFAPDARIYNLLCNCTCCPYLSPLREHLLFNFSITPVVVIPLTLKCLLVNSLEHAPKFGELFHKQETVWNTCTNRIVIFSHCSRFLLHLQGITNISKMRHSDYSWKRVGQRVLNINTRPHNR